MIYSPVKAEFRPSLDRVFRNDCTYMTGFNFIKHFLKSRTIIGHTAVAVINEKCQVGEVVISCVLKLLKQHGLLILDRI